MTKTQNKLLFFKLFNIERKDRFAHVKKKSDHVIRLKFFKYLNVKIKVCLRTLVAKFISTQEANFVLGLLRFYNSYITSKN